MSDEHVMVDGRRYKISGAQMMAFEHQRSAVILGGNPEMQAEARNDRDAFLADLPVWALEDLLDTAECLAARVQELLDIRTAP